MPYFKDQTARLYFLDDAKDSNLLPAGCAPITAAEVDQLRAPTAEQIKAAETAKALAALTSIDLASIRSIREYIVSKPDAPQILKDREAAAVVERVKVKP